MNNLVDIQNNVVIKKINKPFINITYDWFERYTKLSDNNKYLVKVLDIDPVKNIVVMENLGDVEEVEQCLKQPYLRNRVSKTVLCDIVLASTTTWAQSIEYSKSLPNNDFFVHTDLDLKNIVLTKAGKVKVIDPDSFVIVDKLKYTEKFYMSQINLMANIGIFYNEDIK